MNPVLKVFTSVGLAAALLCPCCTPKAAAEAAPAQTAPATSSAVLTVDGMTCASCSVAVRTVLKRIDGVRDARVNVTEKRAMVDYDPAKVTPQELVDAVNKLGYKATLVQRGT